MALHRRSRDEIDRIYAYYEERYEKPLAEVFHPKVEGLQARRAAQLRLGNLERADAYAIEDKRLQIEKLEQETLDFDVDDPTGENGRRSGASSSPPTSRGSSRSTARRRCATHRSGPPPVRRYSSDCRPCSARPWTPTRASATSSPAR